MRAAGAPLVAFLRSRQPFWVAELFEIVIPGGTTLNLTSSDQPVTLDGVTYSNLGIAVERSKLTLTSTSEVPEVEVKLLTGDGATVGTAAANLFIHNGGLDGARLTLRRAFMPKPGNVSYGGVTMFTGRASSVKLTGAGATVSFKGDNVLWNQYFPRNLYQAGCIHTLYDAGCTLSQADFTLDAVVGTGTIATGSVPWAGPGNASAYTLGVLTFTSGAAAGLVRTVQFATEAAVIPAYPLTVLPAVGDAFTIAMGCDKTRSVCLNRFNNLTNFRGFPFIPSAYVAL